MKKDRKKEERKKDNFPWVKVGLIAFSVVFVLMFVLNYLMTAGTLQYFRGVRVNDSVTIDFTLRDAQGQPVLTTDQNAYRANILAGGMAFLTSPLTVQAGHTGNPGYTGVDAMNYYLSQSGNTQTKFAILGQELDEMDGAVLGMKYGEKKTIQFSFPVDPISFRDYEFNSMGGNFTQVSVGDAIPIGFSQTPMVSGLEGYNKTPQNEALRMGTVINKTANSLEVDHRYPSADITVRSIK